MRGMTHKKYKLKIFIVNIYENILYLYFITPDDGLEKKKKRMGH
jgi:hypothetical protein